MKIAVLIKPVVETDAILQLSGDGKTITTRDLNFVINPYDEYAIEEAVRLKEKHGGEVTAVSMGDDHAPRIIRQALAMGADKGIHIRTEPDCELDVRAATEILARAVETLAAEVIFTGRTAVDSASSQLPERLADHLSIPHVSAITSFALEGQRATVVCQQDEEQQTVELAIPALFSTEKGLNCPRYPKLPEIFKAKQKPLKTFELKDLGFSEEDVANGLPTSALSLPSSQRAAVFLEGDRTAQVRALRDLLQAKQPGMHRG